MKKNTSILTKLQEKIFSEDFKNLYRTEERFFTRRRLLTFSTIIMIQLNFINRSMSVEISKFLGKFHFTGKEKDVSKQAFSKARMHIKWEGFSALNDCFIKDFYADREYTHYKDKYLLLAGDGTTYELPYEQKLIEEFNVCDNGQGGQPICMAQSVKLFDVLNHMNVAVTFAPYNAGGGKGFSEQQLFEQCLGQLPQLIDCQEHNILLLGDKYYPNFYYFYMLPRLGYDFVFRCGATFCKEVIAFAQGDENDGWLNIDLNISNRKYGSSAKKIKDKPPGIEVRCVKIPLPNGETEYLLTNVNQADLSRQELGEIYDLRWNEETSFDTDKNKVEIENFSAKTPNGVRQDFYGKILAENITQLLIEDAQQQLDEEQLDKDNKHDYQINRAVAIGLVKDELPKFLTGQEPLESWYSRILKKILRRREPVRKHRVFPKKRKHKLKFPITRRRVV